MNYQELSEKRKCIYDIYELYSKGKLKKLIISGDKFTLVQKTKREVKEQTQNKEFTHYQWFCLKELLRNLYAQDIEFSALVNQSNQLNVYLNVKTNILIPLYVSVIFYFIVMVSEGKLSPTKLHEFFPFFVIVAILIAALCYSIKKIIALLNKPLHYRLKEYELSLIDSKINSPSYTYIEPGISI